MKKDCQRCKGSGADSFFDGDIERVMYCNDCEGTGQVKSENEVERCEETLDMFEGEK